MKADQIQRYNLTLTAHQGAGEAMTEVRANVKVASEGWLTTWDVAENLLAENERLQARVKELEDLPCFRAAWVDQQRAGDNGKTGAWLEGRLERLAALEAGLKAQGEEAHVPAYWKERARRAEAVLGERLISAERSISNLEEITAQLLTVGDGVDARLEAMEQDANSREALFDRVQALELPLLNRVTALENHDGERETNMATVVRRLIAQELDLGTHARRLADLSILVTNLMNRVTALEAQSKHQP